MLGWNKNIYDMKQQKTGVIKSSQIKRMQKNALNRQIISNR